VETIEHLFFDCPSTVSGWFALGIAWEANANIYKKLYLAKHAFARPLFKDVFMIGA
jgi:hypothetical protein